MIRPPDPADVVARSSAEAAAELLRQTEQTFGPQAGIAAALAVALGALAFIRRAAGDRAAVEAAEMLREAIALRQDEGRRDHVVVPGAGGRA